MTKWLGFNRFFWVSIQFLRVNVKGPNKEEILKSWYDYFKELPGKHPKITDEKKIVTTNLDDIDLNIKTGHFTNSE